MQYFLTAKTGSSIQCRNDVIVAATVRIDLHALNYNGLSVPANLIILLLVLIPGPAPASRGPAPVPVTGARLCTP